MVVLKYYHRRELDLQKAIDKLTALSKALDKQKDTNALMALEGSARDTYYRIWDDILKNSDFKFEKRSRRPPLDAINALISFGNTLLYATCLSEINTIHLDPRIGFLHATNERNYTLNLDVSEFLSQLLLTA